MRNKNISKILKIRIDKTAIRSVTTYAANVIKSTGTGWFGHVNRRESMSMKKMEIENKAGKILQLPMSLINRKKKEGRKKVIDF